MKLRWFCAPRRFRVLFHNPHLECAGTDYSERQTTTVRVETQTPATTSELNVFPGTHTTTFLKQYHYSSTVVGLGVELAEQRVPAAWRRPIVLMVWTPTLRCCLSRTETFKWVVNLRWPVFQSLGTKEFLSCLIQTLVQGVIDVPRIFNAIVDLCRI